MSVILQINNFVVSQDWEGEWRGTLTNSGDENVRKVKLKVVDTAVFDVCKARYTLPNSTTCLNVFMSGEFYMYNFTNANQDFPAGTTKDVRFDVEIKQGAPIQDNPLVCYWQYFVY